MAQWGNRYLMLPSTPTSRYELELWVNGVQVGDITKLAKNRHFVLKRNDDEELTFDLNIKAFENYCRMAGREPKAMLEAYLTDVRVKRNGQYYFGVEVIDFDMDLSGDLTNVTVKCRGFLSLFSKRPITKTYALQEVTNIARDMITQTQLDYGSFGVSHSLQQYNTGKQRERDYVDQNIRDGLINLTDLIDGKFDFSFSYDRKFSTWDMIGSDRPTLNFTYPFNVSNLRLSRSAQETYNYIIARGSGFGEETIRTFQEDAPSRANYKTRVGIFDFNSVETEDILQDHADAEVAKRKDILQLPGIVCTGAQCDLGVIGVGDRIPVDATSHPFVNLEGTYRIEAIDVRLDDNDAETIELKVDDYGFTA